MKNRELGMSESAGARPVSRINEMSLTDRVQCGQDGGVENDQAVPPQHDPHAPLSLFGELPKSKCVILHHDAFKTTTSNSLNPSTVEHASR